MVSIVSSYPGFHALPRGIKQLLLTSETHFFEEPAPANASPLPLPEAARTAGTLSAEPRSATSSETAFYEAWEKLTGDAWVAAAPATPAVPLRPRL